MFGAGNNKDLFSAYCESPLSIGFWGSTTVNINIHTAMAMYCPTGTRSFN